ncbi:MAG: metallophosphoesterase, partial [Candidatus Asgardarchaeum californiense]
KPVMEIVDEESVLVTHIPPYKTQDRVFLGHHIGSKELREVVETCKPRLVLCGHVHEDPGITKLGNTTVVNCSIGKRTEGVIIEINDEIDVELID